ncbi:hypothetical protein CR194_14945 [Salipaludibacillus keqinensis]|uniref:Probable cytosol aminopeptidase n=1 Tax=Salipaludibacillus keqinensis TaxID=2045207 RepID=A0A323TGD0_9BACI|nr:hypothetical protein [Salipaludibacillus keqinensis]PYZ92934.1 hypothetical protein CR194_14945 [Salipaludibacillus keqinensis]
MIQFTSDLLSDNEKKVLVIGKFAGGKKNRDLYQWMEEAFDVPVSDWLQTYQHWGNEGEWHSLPVYKKESSVKFIYVIGLGREKHSSATAYFNVGKTLSRLSKHERLHYTAVYWPTFINDHSKEVELELFEVMLKGSYSCLDETSWRTEISFVLNEESDGKGFQEQLAETSYLSEMLKKNQQLLELPYELMDETKLLEVFKRLSSYENVHSDIFDHEDLHALGMGGILASAAKTNTSPSLVKLDYNPGKLEKDGAGFFLIGAGRITKEVEYIRNNQGQTQRVYTDRVGALLALSIFEQIAKKKLPIKLSILCPLTFDKSAEAIEMVRLMNEEIIQSEDSVGQLKMKLSDCVSFAKQEKADTVITLGTFLKDLHFEIGGGYQIALTNDPKLEYLRMKSNDSFEQKWWFLPFKRNGHPVGRQLKEVVSLGDTAGHMTWLHIDVFYTRLNKSKDPNHYRLQEEVDVILANLNWINQGY